MICTTPSLNSATRNGSKRLIWLGKSDFCPIFTVDRKISPFSASRRLLRLLPSISIASA